MSVFGEKFSGPKTSNDEPGPNTPITNYPQPSTECVLPVSLILAEKNVECVADCLIGRIEKVYGDGFWSLGAHEASHVLPWLQLVRNGAGVGKLSVLQDIFQIAAVSWLLGNAIDGLSGCAFAGVRFFDASGRCGEGLQALWQRCLADWGCGGTPSCHPSPSDSFFLGGFGHGEAMKNDLVLGYGYLKFEKYRNIHL